MDHVTPLTSLINALRMNASERTVLSLAAELPDLPVQLAYDIVFCLLVLDNAAAIRSCGLEIETPVRAALKWIKEHIGYTDE